ncbi:hypothetical protein GUJ93_ZPchr0004g38629 [Zizania palustris]|uniref:Uncharacterized protein n=1 Tax=Zizania palustris TaxID=103762 RepID=A0A8J5VZF6_ZIZPA|nr:hypothetical protein GUJ93_ZPchr0004g38629 [Zizania palustris]
MTHHIWSHEAHALQHDSSFSRSNEYLKMVYTIESGCLSKKTRSEFCAVVVLQPCLFFSLDLFVNDFPEMIPTENMT